MGRVKISYFSEIFQVSLRGREGLLKRCVLAFRGRRKITSRIVFSCSGCSYHVQPAGEKAHGLVMF